MNGHEQRSIRIYISSTFQDMQEEREVLAKSIFPQLRKLCEERGVAWSEVDLRWGVTDEQTAESQVLPICLAEIDNCRPYFVGLLGERYGWVPAKIPERVIEQEPWLKECHDCSVTELEILHGVLLSPEMAEHAFFYLRDPAYIGTLPPESRPYFHESISANEIEQAGSAEAGLLAADRVLRLVELKELIRQSKFPVEEDYPDPNALGELVLRDMKAVIDKLYPPTSVPDQIEREAAEHDVFAASREHFYVVHQEHFDCLDEHALGGGPPLVIVGESGCGKSALLANWALHFQAVCAAAETPHKKSIWKGLLERSKDTDQRGDTDFIIWHFCGATSYNADWISILWRIMGELKRCFNIKQDIPQQPDELRSTFANWLNIASAKGRLVLIIDALDQIEGWNGVCDLSWLPLVIPPNIRVILSTLPGWPLDELVKRDWPILEIGLLDQEGRQQLIDAYLFRYAMELTPDQIGRIVSAAPTANPLYLRVLLDELRLCKDRRAIDQQIDRYLTAETASDLCQKVLKRYERDYEDNRPGLVRDAMSLLWVARRGLSEPELLERLGVEGQPLPQAYWSPLHLAAEHALISRSGLIGFSHNCFRQAALERYLPTQQDRFAMHSRMANYFDEGDLSPKAIDQLPWHLVQEKSWHTLYRLLTDMNFFGAIWEANRFDAMLYWAQIESHLSFRMVTTYQPLITSPENYQENDLWHVALLFRAMGHPDEALSIWQYFVNKNRQLSNLDGLSGSLGERALILRERGDLDGAMALYKEEEKNCRQFGNLYGLQASISSQALILSGRGDLDRAMALMKEQERICRQICKLVDTPMFLGNRANILYARGDLEGAIALHREQERICYQLGDLDGLSAALGSQANILYDSGDLDRAMVLRKEQERIYRQLGDLHKLQLGNQANILYDRGDLNGAVALHKEEERICRQLGDVDGLAVSLGNQANILYDRSDIGGAIALLKEAGLICRQHGRVEGLATSLVSQAAILQDNDRLTEAASLAEEAYRLANDHGCTDLASIIKKLLDDMAG